MTHSTAQAASGEKMYKVNVLLLLCFAFLFASTVHGQTNTGVNNFELNGNYAFTFRGSSSNGNVSSVYAAVGRFTADGAGNLTNGELDTNGAAAGVALVAQTFTGTYSIGADHRGVMNLNIAGSPAKLAFAMMANGNAEFIKFDASGGVGTIGSGTIEKADTTAYSTAKITGDYAFGAAGFDNANNRAAILGRFTSNGTGTLTNPVGDVNAYGTDYAMNFTAANYTVSNTATGRGAMHFTFTFGGAPANLNFVFYVVNSGKLFPMESDAVTTATPLLNGVVQQQQIPSGGFSNASLSGNTVISLTGLSMCGSGSGVPKAVAGLLTTNGNGALSLTYDENYCRAPNSVTAAAGTYSVAGNGRASITIGGYSLVAYLVNLNQVFLSVSDANVLFGFGEPQAGSFNNSALKGTYAGYATNPATFSVAAFSGEFSADGAASVGNINGTEDIGAPSGPVSGAAFKATYSVASSPTNGRGTMTINSGAGGNAIIYMISASRFVVLPLNDPNPAIWNFELASGSAPAPTSIASLSLNPASVTGGNSSTVTVTLSGPAPSGGAQVALSSSNTTAARVPSSVTVAAGATSATFAVSTSAVASSTSVVISGSYGGATKTGSLTVTATPAPSSTLSSLTLNPSSVVGGAQSSTGTVTLSGPAPAGGAQVMLSSSNGAASVPASVTVPAGASSVTFRVNSSAVLFPTSSRISASYSGTSRSADLTVY
jgi:trimeric autotransporter adhesin